MMKYAHTRFEEPLPNTVKICAKTSNSRVTLSNFQLQFWILFLKNLSDPVALDVFKRTREDSPEPRGQFHEIRKLGVFWR